MDVGYYNFTVNGNTQFQNRSNYRAVVKSGSNFIELYFFGTTLYCRVGTNPLTFGSSASIKWSDTITNLSAYQGCLYVIDDVVHAVYLDDDDTLHHNYSADDGANWTTDEATVGEDGYQMTYDTSGYYSIPAIFKIDATLYLQVVTTDTCYFFSLPNYTLITSLAVDCACAGYVDNDIYYFVIGNTASTWTKIYTFDDTSIADGNNSIDLTTNNCYSMSNFQGLYKINNKLYYTGLYYNVTYEKRRIYLMNEVDDWELVVEGIDAKSMLSLYDDDVATMELGIPKFIFININAVESRVYFFAKNGNMFLLTELDSYYHYEDFSGVGNYLGKFYYMNVADFEAIKFRVRKQTHLSPMNVSVEVIADIESLKEGETFVFINKDDSDSILFIGIAKEIIDSEGTQRINFKDIMEDSFKIPINIEAYSTADEKTMIEDFIDQSKFFIEGTIENPGGSHTFPVQSNKNPQQWLYALESMGSRWFVIDQIGTMNYNEADESSGLVLTDNNSYVKKIPNKGNKITGVIVNGGFTSANARATSGKILNPSALNPTIDFIVYAFTELDTDAKCISRANEILSNDNIFKFYNIEVYIDELPQTGKTLDLSSSLYSLTNEIVIIEFFDLDLINKIGTIGCYSHMWFTSDYKRKQSDNNESLINQLGENTVPKSGGTFSGDINMDSNKVYNASSFGDLTTKRFIAMSLGGMWFKSSSGVYTFFDSAGTHYTDISIGTSHEMLFKPAGTEKMRLDTDNLDVQCDVRARNNHLVVAYSTGNDKYTYIRHDDTNGQLVVDEGHIDILTEAGKSVRCANNTWSDYVKIYADEFVLASAKMPDEPDDWKKNFPDFMKSDASFERYEHYEEEIEIENPETKEMEIKKIRKKRLIENVEREGINLGMVARSAYYKAQNLEKENTELKKRVEELEKQMKMITDAFK